MDILAVPLTVPLAPDSGCRDYLASMVGLCATRQDGESPMWKEIAPPEHPPFRGSIVTPLDYSSKARMRVS